MMGWGRRFRRAFRRVSRPIREIQKPFERVWRSVGDVLLPGEDKTQQMLIERQNKLLEEQKKKTEEMLKASKLKEEEDARLAASVTGEQTNLTEGQTDNKTDFSSSGTGDIDTSWLDGVIDEGVNKDEADKNIVI